MLKSDLEVDDSVLGTTDETAATTTTHKATDGRNGGATDAAQSITESIFQADISINLDKCLFCSWPSQTNLVGVVCSQDSFNLKVNCSRFISDISSSSFSISSSNNSSPSNKDSSSVAMTEKQEEGGAEKMSELSLHAADAELKNFRVYVRTWALPKDSWREGSSSAEPVSHDEVKSLFREIDKLGHTSTCKVSREFSDKVWKITVVDMRLLWSAPLRNSSSTFMHFYNNIFKKNSGDAADSANAGGGSAKQSKSAKSTGGKRVSVAAENRPFSNQRKSVLIDDSRSLALSQSLDENNYSNVPSHNAAVGNRRSFADVPPNRRSFATAGGLRSFASVEEENEWRAQRDEDAMLLALTAQQRTKKKKKRNTLVNQSSFFANSRSNSFHSRISRSQSMDSEQQQQNFSGEGNEDGKEAKKMFVVVTMVAPQVCVLSLCLFLSFSHECACVFMCLYFYLCGLLSFLSIFLLPVIIRDSCLIFMYDTNVCVCVSLD